MICTEIVCVGAAGYEYHGKALGVGRGERVERRQGTHGVSDYTGCGAVCARIAFSSKSTIEFIATVDLLDVLVEEKLIQKNKVVVPGYGKVMLKPYLLKPGCQIAAYRDCRWRGSTV